MAQVWQHSRLWFAETVFIGSALSLLASPTLAQIVPDTSLGAESSRFTPNSNVRGQAADRIDGGALRGANLFHSFSDFNVNDGQRVYFSNPVGVNNILSRVTGTNLSNISGTLGVDGGANLFLLNPNGIIFGPNARLDISGSFVGSTADRFAFPAGGEFGATNPQAPPLLTVSLPLGLQYGRGDITNRGNLTTGQDLALFGNTLDLQGRLQAGRDLTLQAQGIVQARDSQTAPFVASAGSNLSIQGTQGIDILALSHPQSQILSGGNLSLVGDGTISGDVHFASGGNFSIRSATGGLANFVSLYDPIISATGNVDLAANYSGASLLIESQGNVRVQGTVDVTAPDTVSSFVGADAVLGTQAGLIVRSGQNSLVYGGTNQNSPPAFTGRVIPDGVTLAGAVTTAGGSVLVNAAMGNVNTSSITTQGGELRLNTVGGDITATGTLSTSNGALDGGNITLDAAGNITTTDLNSSSASEDKGEDSGNGGAIAIQAQGDVTTADIFSSSLSRSGNSNEGGVIMIQAQGNITTSDIFSSSSSLSGNSDDGGAITIQSRGNITTSDIFSSSLSRDSGDSGDGGAITIRATRGNITTRDLGSYTYSESGNSGNGGTISLFPSAGGIGVPGPAGASERVALNSFSFAEQETAGSGGDVILRLPAGGDVRNLAILTRSSSSDSGEIRLRSAGSSLVFNTRILSILTNRQVMRLPFLNRRIFLSEQGQSSNVTIRSRGNLSLNNTRIVGNFGDITIDSSRRLKFNNSRIFSNISSIGQPESITEGSDLAGDITITSGRGIRFDNSRIFSNTSSIGQAESIIESRILSGDITITNDRQITFNNTFIRSDTSTTGQAGSISVATNRLELQNQSELTSGMRSRYGGDIRLQALDSLTMRGESLIYTDAVEALGGGVIIINTGRLLSDTDNNDIIALGRAEISGIVQIHTPPNSIVNFTEQSELSFDDLRGNSTSDISGNSVSASGYLERDPTQGTVELPTDLIDASNLVVQGCGVGEVTTARDLSAFVITGRGGLSSSPTERLSDNTAMPNWMMLDSEASPAVPETTSTIPQPIDAPIVEAQGWSIGSNGEVVLIAPAPTVTPQPPTAAQASCNAARN